MNYLDLLSIYIYIDNIERIISNQPPELPLSSLFGRNIKMDSFADSPCDLFGLGFSRVIIGTTRALRIIMINVLG